MVIFLSSLRYIYLAGIVTKRKSEARRKDVREKDGREKGRSKKEEIETKRAL